MPVIFQLNIDAVFQVGLPNTLTGKVRIEHDTWSATASNEIAVGKKVVVKASEGVHVTVEEAP